MTEEETRALLCGCIVSVKGHAIYEPCENIQSLYADAMALVKKGIGMSPEDGRRLQVAEEDMRAHVRAGRTARTRESRRYA